MREIPLTQGEVALVDDADYANLARKKVYQKRGFRTAADAIDFRDLLAVEVQGCFAYLNKEYHVS